MKFLFHVHKLMPEWRAVIRDDLGWPEQAKAEQWTLSRVRLAEDTNADVRREIEAKGYSLFRLGGTFADVEAELARRG